MFFNLGPGNITDRWFLKSTQRLIYLVRTYIKKIRPIFFLLFKYKFVCFVSFLFFNTFHSVIIFWNMIENKQMDWLTKHMVFFIIFEVNTSTDTMNFALRKYFSQPVKTKKKNSYLFSYFAKRNHNNLHLDMENLSKKIRERLKTFLGWVGWRGKGKDSLTENQAFSNSPSARRRTT